MGNPLRDRRTAKDWAASGQVIEIAEELGSFERLAGIVEADLAALAADKLPAEWRESVISGQLDFGFSDAQPALPALDGRLQVTLDAVCQRCLEPFRYLLSTELRLLFPETAASAGDTDEYEVWELDEKVMRPLDLVEEALIMALPLVAMHADDDVCSERGAASAESGKKLRPFANLKTQMDKEKD